MAAGRSCGRSGLAAADAAVADEDEADRTRVGMPVVVEVPVEVAAVVATGVDNDDGGTEVTAASAEDEDDDCGKRLASVSTGADSTAAFRLTTPGVLVAVLAADGAADA